MRWRASLLILLASAAVFCLFICGASLRPDDLRPGIGDPEVAKGKVKEGMTEDEVRSLLGRPHSRMDGGHGDAWTYRCDFFGGTRFRVNFGPDGRVTDTEWWLQ